MARSRGLKLPTQVILWTIIGTLPQAFAQRASPEQLRQITTRLEVLREGLNTISENAASGHGKTDVAICAKAAEWILRHEEFYKPGYVDDTLEILSLGDERAVELRDVGAAHQPSWMTGTSTVVLGYRSHVDGSVQPYALSFPENFDPNSDREWPLTIKLHGRHQTMNEVHFIRRFSTAAQPPPFGSIQLDVFGRTNNAYRWSGEVDVFEALADVKQRFRIDDRRITLWGFSMGGAGAWHLGLHYPAMWSSVGAGAGFVDFYDYQNQTSQLPPYQHRTLHIYDAVDYAMNAANVPFITYGGEVDKQLAASLHMKLRALKLNVPLRMLIGKGMGHKFDDASSEAFQAFLAEHAEEGRPFTSDRKDIRFITYTPKYNRCDWLTVEEMDDLYAPATVEGGINNDGKMKLRTTNVTALSLDRTIADQVSLDEQGLFELAAASGEVGNTTFVRQNGQWQLLSDGEASEFQRNPDLRKRHNLQGPIDDAFMQPFVCVRGTGTPWSQSQHDWASWTLARFEHEFDKWMRGKVPVVDDTQLTEEQIEDCNLILFGDPGSNDVLNRVLDRLPVSWTPGQITVNGKSNDPSTHGLVLIYPNPLNPRRYVVVNSGHTMHESDFRASNSWLFPKLGDIAVVRFEKQTDGSFEEETVWADLFDRDWKLSSSDPN